MMQLVAKEISEKEKEIWNDFLKRNESGHLFQTFEWGLFKKTQGWQSRRIALQGPAGEIKAVLSILEKKVPLTGLKIWYLPRGPVLDFQNKKLVKQVFDFLIASAKEHKVMAVKISPDVVLKDETKWIPELLKNKGFKETDDYQLHKCTIRIDLKNKSEDEILADFKKNTRWEIKKGEEIKIEIEFRKDENELKDFYRLYTEAMKKDRLSYGYFKNLWQTFKNYILILIAYQENYGDCPLSGGFIINFNHKYWYLFGGSTKKHPTHNSSQALQWDAIKRIKEKDPFAKFYDLQGIPCGEPKTPHDKGVLQFKDGFGGERIELIGEFDYVFFPILYRIFRKLNQARIIIKGIIGRV